jgi:acetyl esterase
LPAVGSSEDLIACHGSSSVPVRVHRPVDGEQVTPTIVFFHGGGFVLGSVELMDDIARKICRDTKSVVVSVEYRLAPEHPYPAAHDDALTATLWAINNVARLGQDPTRIAVAGESAGAVLAASTAITLQAHQPGLAAQLLVVPGLDFARDVNSPEMSSRDYPMISPDDLKAITRLYLSERLDEANQFPPSPMYARTLDGLPPTLVAVAGHDPLYAEGIAYAEKLRSAGVFVELLRFENMFHPFFGFFQASASAMAASDEICRRFRKMLSHR